jgi:hypothetical protein
MACLSGASSSPQDIALAAGHRPTAAEPTRMLVPNDDLARKSRRDWHATCARREVSIAGSRQAAVIDVTHDLFQAI